MKKNCFLIFIFALFSLVSFGQKSLTGVITSVKGKTFIVKADNVESVPAKTDSCDISKDISGTKNPFGITVSSGWMGIGDVMLTNASGKNLTFKIIKETTSIVINGKKQVQFAAGKKVKVEWGK
ncbi:MAG: hypothetical protein Q8M29_04720 [Bacteroidota bacterium]|nr:hypothetical protein [Bacteroidota bacterium]